MSPVMWLVPIGAVVVLAAASTAWVARPRKPLTMDESMRAHKRFRDALPAESADDEPTVRRL